MIPIKTPSEIAMMAQAGQILAKIVRQLKDKVEPGLTTQELDKLAQGLIFSYGVKPAFKGYRGFPASLCTSINEQIVHALPSARKLTEGDILSLDLGIIYPAPFNKRRRVYPALSPKRRRVYPVNKTSKSDFYVDMAVTLAIGSVSPEIRRLIRVTKKALIKAIARVKPGKRIGDISFAIQKHVEAEGLQVVRGLCGHGIGQQLHEEPEIPNFGHRDKGPELKLGMVLALEPMVVLGQPGIKKTPDGFGYQTSDNSLSAHFEHTVAVTQQGAIVLTE